MSINIPGRIARRASLRSSHTSMTVALPKAARYIISGSTGAVVNIGTLFLLTHFLGVWYLASSVCAFITSFFVSFYLQRTWTFEQNTPGTMTHQMTRYFGVAIFNLLLNTGIVYVAVEYLGVWYVLAQILASVIVAVSSFFIYQHLIFNESQDKQV